jgi:hypothetical protein
MLKQNQNWNYFLEILFIIALILVTIKTKTDAIFVDLGATQNRSDVIITGVFDSTSPIGQSFTAKKPYLSTVKIYFQVHQNRQDLMDVYKVTAHLKNINLSDIAIDTKSISNNVENQYIEFEFPPQPKSYNKRYYLLLETDSPPGALSIWSNLYDSYGGGNAYIGGDPLPYDLTFSTFYSPPIGYWVIDTTVHESSKIIQLFVTTVIFMLLGFLICFLLDYHSPDIIDLLTFSVGVGVVVPPILFFSMSLSGIDINRNNILIALAIILSVTVAKLFLVYSRRLKKFHIPRTTSKELVAIILIFVLTIITRASQVSGLLVPNWIDGIVHQSFLEKLISRQTLSFSAIYPQGFHSNVVFEHFLTGNPLQETALMMGQWLSVISGFTFYLLSRKYLRYPYTLFAIILYGFWGTFPAYLINWGRYPYLQGLMLVPIAIIAYKHLENSQLNIVLFVLTAIGIGLTHYGSLIILLAYISTSLIVIIFGRENRKVSYHIKILAISTLPILLILLPKLNNALSQGILGESEISTNFTNTMNTLNTSLQHSGWIAWILGGLGLIFALILKIKNCSC